jgi:hypothetical protein
LKRFFQIKKNFGNSFFVEKYLLEELEGAKKNTNSKVLKFTKILQILKRAEAVFLVVCNPSMNEL